MLKLTRDDRRPAAPPREERDTLPFPAEALRQLRCRRLTAGRPASDAVRLAEWALGNAQLRIDELRAMFGPDDAPPPRAA